MEQFRVFLKGMEQKTFTMPGGKFLTLLDGAILDAEHAFVSLYPSFVRKIELLVEAPITEANIAIEEVKAAVDTTEKNVVNETALVVDEAASVAEAKVANAETAVANTVKTLAEKVAELQNKEEALALAVELEIQVDKRKSFEFIKEVLLGHAPSEEGE
jgi:hypothetical protein